MGGGRTTEPNRPQPADHLPKKQARRTRCALLLSEDAAEALEEAQRDLFLAGEDPERLAAAQARYDAAQADVEKATLVLHFRGIGRKRYDDLIDEHPPTEKQLAKYRERKAEEARKPLAEREYVPAPAFDLETFAPALISAALTDPVWTPEQVDEFFSGPEWNVGEIQLAFNTAMDAQTDVREVGFPKGSRSTRS